MTEWGKALRPTVHDLVKEINDTNINEFKEQTNQNIASINEGIDALQTDKADKIGCYENLTAGAANTLFGSDTETEMFTMRISANDGMVRIESLQGNTLVDGTLLPVRMEGVETTDADDSVLFTREIPVATYFPNGMFGVKVGDSERRDELQAGKVVKRFTEKTISRHGTITAASGAVKFYAGLEVSGGWASNENWESAAAATADAPYGDMVVSELLGLKDTTAPIYISRTWNGLFAYTNVLTDQSAFETEVDKLTGTKLAVPVPSTTQTINPPLNMAYYTEQGGTESIVIPTGESSAPPVLVTTQAVNADGMCDIALSQIAVIENGNASTNYSVGDYLIHSGILYRVTQAIANGEAIIAGTNVTATTVMDELVRLTS